MSGFLTLLWFLVSIIFWVMLIIFIINKLKKRESKISAKKLIIAFVVGFILLIGAGFTNSDNESKSNDKESSSKADTTSSEKEVDVNSNSGSSSEFSESGDSSDKDPNAYKTGVTYDQIARTPKDFKNKKVQFTGKVIQVIEDGKDVQVRLAIDGNSDNIILVLISSDLVKSSRVLENDLLTVSGISNGTTSYDSTLGGKITVPEVKAKIINDQGKASDDYGE
ncbi:hypothetical protein LNP18_08380 [Leuconostoc citreum]|uniref:hypothetical protein n=1 Tax=Leuconostoc citreum TaxID=33964 RepID=UPI00200B10D4|nr:hypothetical protein [Leuconostoc citreum]MCK8606118.1 hypothetical protein [Leuconostoc citreum]